MEKNSLVEQEMTVWLQQLAEKTQLPPQVQTKVESIWKQGSLEDVWQQAQEMLDPQTAQSCWEMVRQRLQPDTDGWKMLTLMLALAQKSFLRLVPCFGEQVAWDTMGVFSRFVKEHYRELGRYGFDRDYWCWRQISGTLVRLGSLEYETALYSGAQWKHTQPGEPCIMLHIPSDAVLTQSLLDESIGKAREYWPDREFFCDSWLLAPVLDQLLPNESRLRSFRSRFQIGSVNTDNQAFIRWVFNNTTKPTQEWPEQTTLQRNIKQHVLDGGKIGSAWGYLIDSSKDGEQ